MYIYGLILFCTIFFYDISVFDFWVCMIFFEFVLLCVLDGFV